VPPYDATSQLSASSVPVDCTTGRIRNSEYLRCFITGGNNSPTIAWPNDLRITDCFVCVDLGDYPRNSIACSVETGLKRKLEEFHGRALLIMHGHRVAGAGNNTDGKNMIPKMTAPMCSRPWPASPRTCR